MSTCMLLVYSEAFTAALRRPRARNNARGSATAAAASLATISKDLLIQRRADTSTRTSRRSRRETEKKNERLGSDRPLSSRRIETSIDHRGRNVFSGRGSSIVSEWERERESEREREKERERERQRETKSWQSFLNRKIYFVVVNGGPWERAKKFLPSIEETSSLLFSNLFPFCILVCNF